MFVKIFDSEVHGQLCVIAATENDESKPEVRLFFKPDGLGVCSLALIFDDTNDGWNQRDKAFDLFDLETAESMVGKAMEQVKP